MNIKPARWDLANIVDANMKAHFTATVVPDVMENFIAEATAELSRKCANYELELIFEQMPEDQLQQMAKAIAKALHKRSFVGGGNGS